MKKMMKKKRIVKYNSKQKVTSKLEVFETKEKKRLQLLNNKYK